MYVCVAHDGMVFIYNKRKWMHERWWGGGKRIVVSIGFFSGFSEGGEKLHKVKVTYMFQSAFGLWL